MCSPKSPKPAPVVAPLPPVQQARPLGVDDDVGEVGISSLRTSGRNGLSLRGREPNGSSLLQAGQPSSTGSSTEQKSVGVAPKQRII